MASKKALQLASNAALYLQDLIGRDWTTSGPAAAFIRSCMYVGWKVIDAHSILSHNGNTMDLAIGSPCMLKHIYRARLQEVLTRDAFLHDLHVMRGGTSDLAASAELMQAKGLDLHQARQLLNSKREAGLNPWHKLQMIALLCRSKMWRHQQCKHCNMMDGMAHRAWERPAQKAVSYTHLTLPTIYSV